MKRVVRYMSRFGYRRLAKPLLFRHTPDRVHRGLIRTAHMVQNTPGVRSLPKLWSYHNDMLKTEVAGLVFRNPVGLSAGFDKAIEMPELMKHVGFGWMTGGSVTRGVYKGNDGDWFYRLPNSKALVVHAGLPSEGTPVVAQRVAGYRRQLFDDFPLCVSIAKTNAKSSVGDTAGVRDYTESLRAFDQLEQVKLLEINISCPNTFGGEPFTTPGRLEKLLCAVDALKLRKPVFIKMPINLSDKGFDALVRVCLKHNVVGLTIGNLMKDRTVAERQDHFPKTIKGNLGGRLNRDVTTRLIARAYRLSKGKLVIVGVGGVMSAADAYEKIRAGASLVALITGLIYEGPQLVGEINAGLVKLLKRDGYKTIAQAVGSSDQR